MNDFHAVSGFRLVGRDTVRVDKSVPVRVVHPDAGLRLTFVPVMTVPAGWYELELRYPPEGLVDVVAQFVLSGGAVLWQRLPVIARNHFRAHFRLEHALEQLTL